MLTGNEKLEVGGILERNDGYQFIILKIEGARITTKTEAIAKRNYDISNFAKSNFTYIPPKVSQSSNEVTLRVGDTFKNSNNALIEIQGADAYRVRCYSKSWGNPHTYDVSLIKKYINSGLYTDYKSVSQQSIEWVPQVGDWGITTTNKPSWHIPKVGTVFKITDIKGEGRELWNGMSGYVESNRVRKALPHEIPVTTKQWKREDFLNTKIRVDTPEKSKRFQELLFSITKIKFLNYISNTQSNYLFVYSDRITHGDMRDFNAHKNKEIFYDEIFNENNNQQLNQNQNGKSSSIESKSSDGTINRGETTERSSVSIGGCGEGLKTSNREIRIRSVKIGERKRSEGKGLCVGRTTTRSVAI